jgi:hypothetical protein
LYRIHKKSGDFGQKCDNQSMAKGFESKSVENQQLDAAENAAAKHKTQLGVEEIQRQREVASLRLQRNSILNATTTSPHRRVALQAALEHVESQLSALGETKFD